MALNDHQFLVDERDGNGRADGNDAVAKQLFIIDTNGATDVTEPLGRGPQGRRYSEERTVPRYRRGAGSERHSPVRGSGQD